MITAGIGVASGCPAGTRAWFRVAQNNGSAIALANGDAVFLAFLN